MNAPSTGPRERRRHANRRRRLNPNLAKIHLTYDVSQICQLFGVHPNTVYAWVAAGLRAIDGGRPMLIHGSVLRDFVRGLRKHRTQLGPDQMWCVGCRATRRPAGDMVDFEAAIGGGPGNLTGICPQCDSMMNRRVSATKLSQICLSLTVDLRRAKGT